MTTAHNSSTHRYLIPSGSVYILKSKKELYSGGKNSHEYLMTSTERKTVSSHFESDICRELAKLSNHHSPFLKDMQRTDNNKMQHLFIDSLIKVKQQYRGSSFMDETVLGIEDKNCLLYQHRRQ